MKCPNCGAAPPDGTEACPRCHVIFSKLAERTIKNAISKHEAGRKASVTKTSSPMPRLFAMFLVTAALYFFLELDRRKQLAAADLRAREAAAAAQPPAQTAQAAAPAWMNNPWKFEGSVLDLLRNKPVSGVKLVFSSADTDERFSAETGLNGHYALDLKPLSDAGYEVELSHPDYGSKWWDVKPSQLTKKQRHELAGAFQARTIKEWTRHVGRPKTVVKYNFTIFPKELTEEEKRERPEAPPAAVQ